MKIYTGDSLSDILALHNIEIFEDKFSQYMGSCYGACWFDHGNGDIICKTYDAIRSAPEQATVVRVARSIRADDAGKLIEIELTHAEFLFLDPDISDRRHKEKGD